MYILSQNKMNLINVDLTSSVWIKNNENSSYIYISNIQDYECIGIYKTENKVNKVFKDIQNWISAFIRRKYSGGNTHEVPCIYEMPQDDEIVKE